MISGIIAEEEAALFYFLWPACRLFSTTSFFTSLRFGVLRQNSWAPAEDTGGAEGAVLKGIITVRAEDVHDHSVNRLGVVREESAFPSRTPPPQALCSIVAQCGFAGSKKTTKKKKHWWRTVLRMHCCPCEMELDLSSLQEQSPSLSVLSNALGALRLPDAVTVWSGVLWRQRRVIAPWPGGDTEDKIKDKKKKGAIHLHQNQLETTET